jgi:GTP-binding protein HflX
MDAVRSVLDEVGASRVPAIDVFNKMDRLEARERERIRAVYPGAIAVSALTGEGRDELVAAMETRLALDTARVTLGFDTRDERHRDEITQLYRVARILRHVTLDGRVSIEAELPRRVLDRYAAAAEAAR